MTYHLRSSEAQQLSKGMPGTVQWSGFVNTQQEKDQAEEIARGVNGVELVTNSLIVKPD